MTWTRTQAPWPLWVTFAILVVVVTWLLVRLLVSRWPALGPFVVGIMVGAILTLGASRPALFPAAASAPSSVGAGRTPTPPGVGPLPVVTTEGHPSLTRRALAPRAVPALTGTASWYPTSGLVAAAGPRLRRMLGDWRGDLVTVCASTCVRVRLTDWCQCLRGQRGERLIDLSDDAFAELAPLSVGLLRVQVAVTRIVPPATDN